MPLESAIYTADLVTSNPAESDPLTYSADHLRLIKSTIKATFPNFTSGAVQSTQAQIDGATLAVDTNGVTILADTGVGFKTNTTDKITNAAAGEIDIVTGGVVAARFMASSAIITGTLSSTGGHIGPGATPIGAIIIWPFDTLPSGFGVWAWCNGVPVSRTTYPAYQTLCANAAYPYGPGDGSTTVGVPNYQEVTLVGKSTMGGAASPGLLPSIAVGVKTALNSLFGSDTQTIAAGNLPAHKHPAYIYDPTHAHGVTGGIYGSSSLSYNYYGGGGQGGTPAAIAISSAATNVRVRDASSNLDTTDNNSTSNTPLNILQPSKTTNFAIRIA